jgi:DNA helicase HerA-like ATPase
LSDDTASGLVFVRGEGYRIGQVGSFIRIPAGYLDLFGIVSQVGAGAAPGPPETAPAFGNRWLRAELVGEGGRGRKFERGISQYPSIGDPAHVVTESDLATIYAPGDKREYVPIGRVASAESIPAYLDLNKLVARHSAVVGSTGAGKSTTLASLLNSLTDPNVFPSTRIVLLDLHGEYTAAFGDSARVFRINANTAKAERPLHVPYWALTSDELMSTTTGLLAGGAQAYFVDAITNMKRAAKPGGKAISIAADDVTVDTPLPFCIHKLWYDLHCLQYATHLEQPGKTQSPETWALEKDGNGVSLKGDALGVKRPKFRQHKDEKGDAEKIRKSSQENLMRPQTDALEGKLRDPRLDFLFRPGPWSVKEDGSTDKDLDELLRQWVGKDKPITVLDLSGIPPSVLDDLVGAVLRILYDAMFWGRGIPVGARARPLLIALEEAHTYLGEGSKSRAAAAARRIAKEGRKYGVGLMLVSQRPSEIDPTILAQCGTLIAMRLTNDKDRGQIRSCASDNLEGLFAMLPILRTGEALVVGEAVGLPIRALIEPPPPGRRPSSDDPKVVVRLRPDGKPERPGGWTDTVSTEDYSQLVECWRTKDAFAGTKPVAGNPDATPANKK